jgi:HSP20 family molecular chaperone IbpA
MEVTDMTQEQSLQVQDAEKRELEESGSERTRDRLAFVPLADIYETDDAIVVLADMPGVDEGSVDITLEDNVLSLNGYVEPEELEGYSPSFLEYRVGDYVRSFTLSDQIDRDGIEAVIKDGVLRLHLPKIKEARRRKIEIKAG